MRKRTFILLSCLAETVTSQQPAGYFKTPPARIYETEDEQPENDKNQVWLLRTTHPIEWAWNQKPWDAYTITLHQVGGDANVSTIYTHEINDTADAQSGRTFSWWVFIDERIVSSSEVFWLQLSLKTAFRPPAFRSHNFNITSTPPRISFSSSVSSYSTSTPSPSTSSVAIASSSSTAPSSSSPSPVSGNTVTGDNDRSERLALGLGLGLGIPLIVVLCVMAGIKFLGLRRLSVLTRRTR